MRDVPSPAFSGVADSRFPGGVRTFALTEDEFRAKHNEVYSARYGVNTFADLTFFYFYLCHHQ